MEVLALLIRALFQEVVIAGKCLPILWLILFEFSRFLQILSEPCFLFVDARKTFANIVSKQHVPKPQQID